jgi:hypothetical protein
MRCFAVGTGDPFADIDVQCLIPGEVVEDLKESWTHLVECVVHRDRRGSIHALLPNGAVIVVGNRLPSDTARRACAL